MSRLYFLVFTGTEPGRRPHAGTTSTSPRSRWSAPLVVLAVGAALGGLVGHPGRPVRPPGVEPARPLARAGAGRRDARGAHGVELRGHGGLHRAGGRRHRPGLPVLRRRLPRSRRSSSRAAVPGLRARWCATSFRVDELYDLLIIRPLQGAVRGPCSGSSTASSSTRSWCTARRWWSTSPARIARTFQVGDVQRYLAVFAIGMRGAVLPGHPPARAVSCWSPSTACTSRRRQRAGAPRRAGPQLRVRLR